MLRWLALLMCLALPVQAQDMVIAPQFDGAGTFHNGAAPVKQGDLWGLVDRTGRMITPPQYEIIQPGRSGYFAAKLPGATARWNYIDATGGRLFDDNNTMEDVSNFKEGWAAVNNGYGGWHLLNRRGALITGTKFDEVIAVDPPFALIRWGVDWRVVHVGDMGFTNVLDVQYVDTMQAATGLRSLSGRFFTATTAMGQTLMKIDTDGWRPEPGIREMIGTPYVGTTYFDHVGAASDGMVTLQDKQGRWGYYHLNTGRQLWMERFEQIRRFSEGYAAVKQNGKWGYINRRGIFVIQPRFDRAYDLHHGHATVRLGDLRGFLRHDDARGLTEFIPPQFEDVFRFQEGLAPVKLNGKWGYISNGQSPTPKLHQTTVQTLVPG